MDVDHNEDKLNFSEGPTHPDRQIKPSYGRLSRGWGWLASNHDALSAFSSLLNIVVSIVLGLIGVFIAIQVRDITQYQTKIARLEHIPIISFRRLTTNGEGKPKSERLVVYNSGAPPQHFRWSVTTLLTVGYKETLRGETTYFVLPISGWFEKYQFNPDEKDVLIVANSPDFGNLELFPAMIYSVPPGRGFNKVNPQRSVEHLVHLQYSNLLDEELDEYYLVNERDYTRLNYDRAKELADAISLLQVSLRLNEDKIEKIIEMSEKALKIPALKVSNPTTLIGY